VQEQPEAEMVPTPAPQPVQTPVAEQPVAAVAPVPTITQTPEPVAVAPAQPVMVPLPATGNAAASSILGSTALIGATYWYLRSRKQLLRSSRRHASGPQT
jgi:LPXTG-motif cell wall-anchored protein